MDANDAFSKKTREDVEGSFTHGAGLEHDGYEVAGDGRRADGTSMIVRWVVKKC